MDRGAERILAVCPSACSGRTLDWESDVSIMSMERLRLMSFFLSPVGILPSVPGGRSMVVVGSSRRGKVGMEKFGAAFLLFRRYMIFNGPPIFLGMVYGFWYVTAELLELFSHIPLSGDHSQSSFRAF